MTKGKVDLHEQEKRARRRGGRGRRAGRSPLDWDVDCADFTFAVFSFLFSLPFFSQRHKGWVNEGVKRPSGTNGGGTKNKNGSVAAALIERC